MYNILGNNRSEGYFWNSPGVGLRGKPSMELDLTYFFIIIIFLRTQRVGND